MDHEATSDADEPPLVSDASVVEVAHSVAQALRDVGRVAELVGVRDSLAPLARLAGRHRGAVYFNLVESLGRDAGREWQVPHLLRKHGVAYTGNDASALKLALDKGRVRRMLEEVGVPAPRGTVVRSGAEAVWFSSRRRLRYPLFVKPARLDASIAVSQRSVVRDAAELRAQVDALVDIAGGRIVIEEYLPGPELNVAVCPTASGVLHAVNGIDFSTFPDHLMPIVTYDCKWVEESVEYSAQSVPAEHLVDAGTIVAAARAARRALRAVGATGHARVDLRVDAAGQPRVIDVNPNPDLHPDAGFARSLRARGHEYPALMQEIVNAALRRHPHGNRPVSVRRSRTAPGTA